MSTVTKLTVVEEKLEEFVNTSRAAAISGYTSNYWSKKCREKKVQGARKNPRNDWWEIPLSEVLKCIKPGHTPPNDL